jgi:hypothetical protein
MAEKNTSIVSEVAQPKKQARIKVGDSGYSSLHVWIARRKRKPEVCEHCLTSPPKDLANISGEYRRDINDFEWLCRKCHMISDGRLAATIDRNKRVAEQGLNRGEKNGNAKKWIVVSPNGSETFVTNLPLFCLDNHLGYFSMLKVALGTRKTHKGGWKCFYLE